MSLQWKVALPKALEYVSWVLFACSVCLWLTFPTESIFLRFPQALTLHIYYSHRRWSPHWCTHILGGLLTEECFVMHLLLLSGVLTGLFAGSGPGDSMAAAKLPT